jgi:hypothetical protein
MIQFLSISISVRDSAAQGQIVPWRSVIVDPCHKGFASGLGYIHSCNEHPAGLLLLVRIPITELDILCCFYVVS